MTSHQANAQSQSLPSFETLTQGLLACPHPPCTTLASTQPELLRHMREHCPPGAPSELTPRSSPGQACQPLAFRPVVPHRINTSFKSEPISPVDSPMSYSTDTSGSPSCTPDNSRQSSLAPSERRDSAVGPIRTATRHSRNFANPMARRNSGDDKKIRKQEKENENRSSHAHCLSRVEDFLFAYTGWERKEQSGGHGNGAGLWANKGTIMRVGEDILGYAIHRDYVTGMIEGNVEERMQVWRNIADKAADGAPPLENTFIDTLLIQCNHETKSKHCTVHGTQDWRECRRAHTQNGFEIRRNEVRRGLVIAALRMRSRAAQSPRRL